MALSQHVLNSSANDDLSRTSRTLGDWLSVFRDTEKELDFHSPALLSYPTAPSG